LGVWLFISAFLWPHQTDEAMTTAIVGALLVISGGAAIVAEELKYVEAMIGALLFISALVVPHATLATVFNNTLVAVLVIGLSFAHQGTSHGRFDRHAHR
jgi:hypothetical protein